jgi:outer membrane protein TolC
MRQIFLSLCATSILTIAAQTSQLTQQQALEQILMNNSELKSLSAKNEATSLTLSDEASALADPSIDFEHLWGKTKDDNRWNVGVSQSFDWPGVYAKRKAAAKAQGAALAYLYDAKCLEISQQAKQAMINAVYANKRLAMLNEVQSNIKQLSSLVKNGYDKGQLTVLDVKKINLELFSINTKISEVEQELDEAIAELNALNASTDMNVDLQDYRAEKFKTLEAYLNEIENLDPAILAAKQSAAASELAAKSAAASRLPGFSLGYRHAYEDGMHFNGFSVGINLPLFSKRKAAKTALLEAQSASFDAVSSAASAEAEITALYNNAARQRKLLDELGSITLDDSYPELLLTAYKGGELNALNYLLELNYFIEARTDLLSTEHCLRSDLAKLNKYDTLKQCKQ